MIETYKEALELIFKDEKISKYTLENITKWLGLLWNPQDNFKIIHVAWTNWKGSVCQMLFSVFKKSNESVWIFTSPHLLDIKERFETEEWRITNDEFIYILNRILNLNIDLAYFDKCVLIAFEFFKLRKCEYVILEVWVWWRLDTTNIVNPIITTITNIGIDHQHLLWNTIDKISFEKAGIIKENTLIVLNFKNNIIESIAKEKNAEIIFSNKNIETNLLWDFQKQNAWLVYEIAKYLKIEEKNIIEWLKNVKHSWRLQFIKDNLLIDAAHNEDSLKELKNYIDTNLLEEYEKIFYCFSIKKWKDISLVIDNIWKNNNFILLDINNEMLENLDKYSDKYEFRTKEYILNEVDEKKNNLYVVFWSLYMIGEFLNN